MIGASLAGQALFAYAPEAEPGTPRGVEAAAGPAACAGCARQHQRTRPASSSRWDSKSWRGILKFIDADLPRALRVARRPAHSRRPGGLPPPKASHAIKGYIDYLEGDLAPKAKASFRLGREKFEKKLRFEEGITFTADRLLAIALRELHEVQEDSAPSPAGCAAGTSRPAWRAATERHPAAGEVVKAAQDR